MIAGKKSASREAKEEDLPLRAHAPRRKLRIFSRGLFAVLVLAAAFHRPLLHQLVRLIAQQAAAREHVRLTCEVEGSVFSDLVFKKIHGEPEPGALTPIEKIEVERAHIAYSLPRLLRHGPDAAIRSCEIENAKVIARDVERPHNDLSAQRGPNIAKSLRDIFHSPFFSIPRSEVKNGSFTLHTRDGDLDLRGLHARIGPHDDGFIRIAQARLPNKRAWKNISIPAKIGGGHFTIGAFALHDDFAFQKIDVDASQARTKHWSIFFTGKFFTGEATGTLDFRDGISPQTEIHFSATRGSLEKFAGYFDIDWPFRGVVDQFTLIATGNPDAPQSWQIKAGAVAGPLCIERQKFERAKFSLESHDGELRASDVELAIGNNRITAQATSRLPTHLIDFPKIEINGTAQLHAPRLTEIQSDLEGSCEATATFRIKNQQLIASIQTTARSILSKNFSLGEANAAVALTKSLAPQPKSPPFFIGLESQITARLKNLSARGCALDSAEAQLETREQRVHVGKLILARMENRVAANGTFDLPADAKKWPRSFFDLDFSIDAPRICAFNAEPKRPGLNGKFHAKGHIAHRDTFDGRITAEGGEIALQEFTAQKLNVDVAIEKNIANLNALHLAINNTDRIDAEGKITLCGDFDYEGKLSAHIRDLALLQPLLHSVGNEEKIAGSLDLDWLGHGLAAKTREQSGDGKLQVRNARFGEIAITEAALAGTYFPGAASFPAVHIVSNQGVLDGAIELQEGKLRFHDIQFQRGGEKLTGYLILPFDIARIGKPGLFPLDQRIAAVLTATDLDVEKIATSFGKKSPIGGTVTANIFAGGTLAEPSAHLKLAARNLKSKDKPKIEPISLDANIHFSQNELTLAATMKQRQFQPVDLRGKMPLGIERTIASKQIDPQTPLDLKIKLPKTAASALAQFSEDIRYIEGNISLDAQIAGTLAKPQLGGQIVLDMPAVRLRDPSMPSVNAFKADLRFTETRLVVERFSGDVSGGPFSLAGKIGFEKLTEPLLDLRFRSQNLLVARDESLTVRADSDLKISGVFNAANVTGDVNLTKCRFVRDVEILPIELPGRPAPKPPHAENGVSLKPPFAGWKFNVAIKSKDPFLIRGNLTNGEAHADLKLVGPGAALALDGAVRFEHLVAAMPFSKLEIDRGFVYYSPEEPFEPRLDFQGSSNMRDYNIDVSIFGTASRPQTVLSSEPPLPQDEIVALLATGATRKDLTGAGNRDVVAGRAAVLAFQELYRKIFKRKPAAENSDSFLSRFAIDVGAVDPRTGKQQVSTRFKLGENFYLVGDVDVQGDVRGQVKYLMRFR